MRKVVLIPFLLTLPRSSYTEEIQAFCRRLKIFSGRMAPSPSVGNYGRLSSARYAVRKAGNRRQLDREGLARHGSGNRIATLRLAGTPITR